MLPLRGTRCALRSALCACQRAAGKRRPRGWELTPGPSRWLWGRWPLPISVESVSFLGSTMETHCLSAPSSCTKISQLFRSYLRPLLQSVEIPRETNCLVSHSCWKQHEGLESGRPPSGCHKQALSLHPRAGLRLPLRGNTERFICGKHCVKSLWKVPQQIPLPRGGA